MRTSANTSIEERDLEQELCDQILKLRRDPYKCVRYSFPWGDSVLGDSKGPRKWQREILEAIGGHLSDPETRFTPCRMAVSSGHGIGKSALVSWIIHWAQSTCKDCKVIVTANTGTQLSTKTVPEVSKWFRLAINTHWWDVNATSIKVKGTNEPTWRTDFIPWSDYNTEAFAGLHNQGKRIVLIFDEASAISDRIWEVAEGALTDSETEIIWLAFGNPTQNTGRFRECFGRFKHRWRTFQIDSRTVEGTNKTQINKWIEDYGEDSDFVRVRVRGEFPRAGSSQFIPSDTVAACRKYKAEGYQSLPKILSVDVARFGDDQTVVGMRQGRKFEILKRYRGLDTVQIAERVIEFMQSIEPDATIVDGIGVGAGVIDQLNFRGFGKRLFEYNPSRKANDSAAYYNARTEMWGKMEDWLKVGAQIPDDPELEADLTGVEYRFSSNGQVQLESKEDMKARGLASPDSADCLAMTFQPNVSPPKAAPKPVYQYPGQANQNWMGG